MWLPEIGDDLIDHLDGNVRFVQLQRYFRQRLQTERIAGMLGAIKNWRRPSNPFSRTSAASSNRPASDNACPRLVKNVSRSRNACSSVGTSPATASAKCFDGAVQSCPRFRSSEPNS